MNGKKILVADDDPHLVQLIEALLKARGYQVVIALDGEEALDRAQKALPDLVIVDLRLPKLDGWRVCQKLRRSEKTRHIPLIVLSGLVDRQGAREGLDQGDFYFTKPFDTEQLVAKIKELLEKPLGKPAKESLPHE